MKEETNEDDRNERVREKIEGNREIKGGNENKDRERGASGYL